jgi:hypothetical protein
MYLMTGVDMTKLGLYLSVLLLLALLGCGSGNNEYTTDTDVQVRATPGQVSLLQLTGGYALTIPGDTFDNKTTVLFSSRLFNELTIAKYPTPSPVVGDLISGAVINTPADVQLHQNLQMTFGLTAALGAHAGDQYVVYHYDRFNGDWFAWGHTVATVDATGLTATASLPTTNLQGFVGSVALFKGMTPASLPAGANTVIQGTVINSQSQPLATDVSVYVFIGEQKYPAAVLNGRVPAGGSVANTVDSAADGTFTIQVPDCLIAQTVSIQFGVEDTAHAAQQRFDILAPAVPLTNASILIVRFGANNIRSRPVAAN